MTTRPADDTPTTNLVQLFEAQVRKNPGAIAVVAPAASLTYAELDAAANRVATHLETMGVGPDVIVGICMERSIDAAVGLLGILKAGGACMPQTRPGDQAPTLPKPRAKGDHLAYLIYTSGSTGRPNGVLLGHRGLINHARAAVELYGLTPSDRVLQFCSISFDVSIEELFPTWASGATVVLRPENLPVLGRQWLDWLGTQAISICNLPTAYWHEWVRDLSELGEQVPPSVRAVVVGGERALGSAYRAWLRVGGDRVRWFNAYGPTETSVMATIHEAPRSKGAGPEEEDPPIGRTLPNMQVHVLGPDYRPVAPGEPGEAYIGGVGLAWGYLNQPELTAQRFVPDPFCAITGKRIYRTGDMVRVRPDGELAFLCRVDDQVKVRGFRIECGEVESALRSHPDIYEAVVVAREDTPGDRRLVAYVLIEGRREIQPGELRRWLAGRLPSYMLPSRFVTLASFPLTQNGKVDRHALPGPEEWDSGERPSGLAPTTATESALLAIWSDVLGIEGFGIDENFFDLGGHSILAAWVVARTQEELGVNLALSALFESPTIATMARTVDRLGDEANSSILPPIEAHPRPLTSRLPLSLPQEQMWAVETRAGRRIDNNVTATLLLPAPADQEALHAALAFLVERHEALRTSFPLDGGQPYQSICDAISVALGYIDLSGEPLDRREEAARALIREQDAASFDLGHPPLFAFHLLRLGQRHDMMVLTFDHMICDGPSAYILLSELKAAYEAFVAGQPPRLPRLTIGYADFAIWQRRWLTDERLNAQLEYWNAVLAGMPLGPALPFDHIPVEPTRRIARRPLSFGPDQYEGMSTLGRASRSSMFGVCVAAVSAVLGILGETDDVVLSTTLGGRQRAEVEGVVGNFAGTGRIRVKLSGDASFETILARARMAVLGLFENQDIPFFRVRDALIPDFTRRSGGRPPLHLLPVELGYFRASHDHWAPGRGVVENPGREPTSGKLFFKGQLHPLSLTFFDDGAQMWGEASYKVDFYDDTTIEHLACSLEALVVSVTADPATHLSQLVSKLSRAH